jgi:Ca2+-binding RTX toxin-like protein
MTQLRLGPMPAVFGVSDPFLVAVSDVRIFEGAFGTVVYSITPPGGAGLAGWMMNGSGNWVRHDFAGIPGSAQAGLLPEIFALDAGASTTLTVTGVNNTGLLGFQLDGSGRIPDFGAVPALQALPSDLSTLHDQFAGGQHFAYGSRLGQNQIEMWQVDGNGRLSDHRAISTQSAVGAVGLVAMDGGMAGNQPILVAATDGADSMLVFRLASNGIPQLSDRIAVADGLGIATPVAVEVVEVAGRLFAILAASGSNSISVFEIGANGQATPTEHIIDNLGTRFANVTQLAVTAIGDSVFVVAAGGDDGVSVFQLLPGGRLLHHMTMEDTTDIGLKDISGLDMLAVGGALKIAVSSRSETGLTWLSLEAGPQGVVREGTAAAATIAGTGNDDLLSGGDGDERLLGGARDDILRDGAGSDTLTGGIGADIFVLDSDGEIDEITDFQPGIDRIDLSGWTFLRSASQLTLYEQSNGIDIAFGNEVLKVRTMTGAPISAASVGAMNLIDLDRILPFWFEVTQQSLADKTGGAGNDTLTGGMSNDRLDGAGGADYLLGAGGDDTLDGGTGSDYLNGGPGSDEFRVDDLGDQVVESPRWAGHDHVTASVDFWMGRAHIEDLTLSGSANIRGVGNGLMNVIEGNAGDNILDGGKNNDTLIGGQGNDSYYLRAPGDTAIEAAGEGIDVIRAFRSVLMPANIERMYLQTTVALNGIGNDEANLIVGNMAANQLIGRGGRDTLKGLGGADAFVFDRAPGNNNVDRIIDFVPGEDRIWIKANLFGLATGDVTPDMLHFGKHADDPNDRVMYDSGTGGLWIDPDGSGPARQMLTFVLEGHVALTAEDLLFF